MTGPRLLPDDRTPVLLSAHEESLISQDATAILRYMEQRPSVSMVSATLLRTRRIRGCRAAVRAADRDELITGLRALEAATEHPLVARSARNSAPRTAFVFPGQGNHWPGMGSDAYHRLDVYRAEADACEEIFSAAGSPSPVAYLTGEGECWTQVQTQAAQFTHAVALARVWQSLGVHPQLTIGHSLGEIAAAYVAGAVRLSDAIGVVTARAAVVEGIGGCYGMAVVGVSAGAAAALAATTPGWLEVAVVNSPSSTVISGEIESIAEVVRRLTDRGVFAREIPVNYPAHTSALGPLRDSFLRRLPDSSFSDAAIEFVGTARGSVVPAGSDFREYWFENLRNTARFDRAVAAARDLGAVRFVELSAHPALMLPLSELLDNAAHDTGQPILLDSSRRDRPLLDHLSASITAAAVADPDYRWADLVPTPTDPPLPRFPNAPMKATRLWACPDRPRRGVAVDPLVAVETWEPTVASQRPSTCRIAVVGTAGADAAVVEKLGAAVVRNRYAQPSAVSAADVVAVVGPVSGRLNPPQAAEELTRLVGRGVLDYAEAACCQAMWLITAAGERSRPKDTQLCPLQSALAAMHRSMGFEHADTAFAHLDLPDWDIDDDMAGRVAEALLGAPGEVALRDSGIRYERRLLFDTAPTQPLPVAALENVVVTGGSGAVGMELARKCVELGARRITLLSRGGADPAAIEVHRPGVEVVAVRCDVTDPAAVTAAARQTGADASLLIHAAGVAVLRPHRKIAVDDVQNTLAAKVGGLATMLERWPLRTDCRIVLCSSASAVWGGHGHVAYSAANRMLDIIAARLRADGRHAVSVRSGLWETTGIIGSEEIVRIERSGLTAMSPAAAADILLAANGTDPLVFSADLDRLQLVLDSNSISAHFGKHAVPAAGGDDQPFRNVRETVRAEVAAVLGLAPNRVDLEAALTDIGVDSLLALDLRRRLRLSTGRPVSLAPLLGGISGAELAQNLDDAEGVGIRS